MQQAFIKAIDYYLPISILDNAQLSIEFPELPAEKILKKTGIQSRHIAAQHEFSMEMAIKAAENLFAQNIFDPQEIDFLLFCTQTPNQLLPSCACIIQQKLGLTTTTGALDFNLGCSGYVYGLSLAKALIESQQAKNVLLLTADTYSKLIEPTDKTVKTIFGDGASATLISHIATEKEHISKCAYGTNGEGAQNLCAEGFGLRGQFNKNLDPFLRMKGPDIFEFTLNVVPIVIEQALHKAGLTLNEIDLFIFHQANLYMLEHLRKKLNIPEEKFIVEMALSGNTVSSTIPIAIREHALKGIHSHQRKALLVGFGIGYSWAANIVDLTHLNAQNK